MTEGEGAGVSGEGGTGDGGTGDGNNGGNGGSAPVDLMTMLPEDIRGLPSITKFNKDGKFDLGNFAKSYLESEKITSKVIGGQYIPKINEKSTPEEIKAFHKAMGVPDSPDKYGLEKPKELPEGMTYDENRTKMFSEVAHKLGISAAQLKGLHDAWNQSELASYKAATESSDKFMAESVANMKKEWGADYDSNLSKADAVIVRVFGEGFQKMLKETGLANHPDIVKGMFKASQVMGEHSFVGGGEGAAWQGDVPTKEKLHSMMSDARYSRIGQRDYAYVKEVEAYSKKLTEYMETKGEIHKTSNWT